MYQATDKMIFHEQYQNFLREHACVKHISRREVVVRIKPEKSSSS